MCVLCLLAAFKIAQDIQVKSGPKLVDFKRVLMEDQEFKQRISQLKDKVEEYARKFPLPGIPDI